MKAPAANRRDPVLPHYFGAADRPLFGCYHEPQASGRRKCAVLICQPLGHEYINCHRALRQLAVRFAEAGFPVLRFDYHGCGDSSGSSEEGTIAQWLEDISTAICRVREKTGLAKVCLAGLRFGGTLSAILGEQRGDVESLVLWDPVVNGRHYVRDLFSLQKEMLRFRPRPRRGRLEDHTDILGFPLSNFLRNEIEKIDLLQLAPKPAQNVLIIQSDQPEVDDRLRVHLSSAGGRHEYQWLKAPHLWLPATDGSLLVPTQVLHTIVSWTSRVHP